MSRKVANPEATFKPIPNAPAAQHRELKTIVKAVVRRRAALRLAREIGQLPGRTRNGYANQVKAMVEICLVLIWLRNAATGYVHASMTEIANSTGTATTSAKGWKGYGKIRRALKRLRQLGYISFERGLLDPKNGGRDPLFIVVNPSLLVLFGIAENAARERSRKELVKLTSKEKKKAENGHGLPISTLDALAEPTTAARLLGLWQWFKYNKLDFRRFFLAVRRAGLAIVEPASQQHPAFDPPTW